MPLHFETIEELQGCLVKNQQPKKHQPNPRRQMQGAINRASGESFENLLTAACAAYEMEGTASIKKTPERLKVIRPLGKGQFVARFVGAAQHDFKGTLKGGRAVCFEAKHTAADRIEQNELTDEQARELETHYQLGAVCFVIVSLNFQDFYRVPWEVWRDMKQGFGHKYMSRNKLTPYRVLPDSKGVLRFLAGIRP